MTLFKRKPLRREGEVHLSKGDYPNKKARREEAISQIRKLGMSPVSVSAGRYDRYWNQYIYDYVALEPRGNKRKKRR